MKCWRPIHFGLGDNYEKSLRLCQNPGKALEVAEFIFRSPEYINEENSVAALQRSLERVLRRYYQEYFC